MIDLFTWAFSLDLLGGADGALAPISDAITSLYENVIGEAWMVAAILIAGIWGIWKALVQRRYTETAGALAVSVLFVLIALFFVYQPQRTIGEASRWTNTLSLAFLSGANRGSLDDPQQAKHQVADHLFETLDLPAVGRARVRRARATASTPTAPTTTASPGRSARTTPRATSAATTSSRAATGTAATPPRYLSQPPGSEERKAEYDALREGELPVPTTQPVRRLSRSTRPTRPRSTSSRPAAPSSA